MLLDTRAREVLRKQMWQVADFCGVEVLTYCILSNHFHILARVPYIEEVTDGELLRRCEVLYPWDRGRVETIRRTLDEGSEPDAEQCRRQLAARMGDVSVFMKELKQRFTIWYNKNHDRYGTLWAERFKSVLVENREGALKTVAAYIDLNPVRAGIREDPKDYRWCGYAEAVGGSSRARCGISYVLELPEEWRISGREYRMILFGKGYTRKRRGEEQQHMTHEAVLKILSENGELSVSEALRCRIRYFTDGAVLGSKQYLEEQNRAYRDRMGKRRKSGPKQMRGCDWGGLMVLRELRNNVFG